MRYKFTILFLILGLALSACNPFKVTDPHDPRFKSEDFSFLSYGSLDELTEVLNHLLPKGTSKSEVELFFQGIKGVKKLDVYYKEKKYEGSVYVYEPASFLDKVSYHLGSLMKPSAGQKYRVIILFNDDENVEYMRVKH